MLEGIHIRGGGFGKSPEQPKVPLIAGYGVDGAVLAAEHRRPLRTTHLAAGSSAPRALQEARARWSGYYEHLVGLQLVPIADFDKADMLRAAGR